MATNITHEVLKEMLDEVCVRMGPGWNLRIMRNGHFQLEKANHPYTVKVDLQPRYMLIGGFLNDIQLRRYTQHLPQERVHFTESSAKMAEAINIKIVPMLQEAYEYALKSQQDDIDRPNRIPEIVKELYTISPHLTSDRWAEENVTLMDPHKDDYGYPRKNYNLQLRLQGQLDDGQAAFAISGRVPISIAKEVLRLMEAYFYPEGVHEEAHD